MFTAVLYLASVFVSVALWLLFFHLDRKVNERKGYSDEMRKVPNVKCNRCNGEGGHGR